jgi:hypothetical protein
LGVVGKTLEGFQTTRLAGLLPAWRCGWADLLFRAKLGVLTSRETQPSRLFSLGRRQENPGGFSDDAVGRPPAGLALRLD